PATLSIPDGKGPVDLTVTAQSAAGSDEGNVIDIDITSAGGPSVEPGACTVTVYNKTVKLAGSQRLFLGEGKVANLKVKLMSTALVAPADVTFTVGANSGTGSNSLTWTGGTSIPVGGFESTGTLSIMAGLGVNTMQFTVGGGFSFTETGTDTLVFQVVGFTSPIYVAGTGSDNTGTGTQANPLRSIAKALTLVPRIMEIRVGPGLYDAANGETFRIIVPAGVSIVGTMGAARDENDSSVLDGGGAGEALRLMNTPSDTRGLIKDLVLTNFLTAINFSGWRGEVDGCYFTGSASGATSGMLLYSAAADTDFTLRNCIATQMTNTAASYFIWVDEGGLTGKFTIDGCEFSHIIAGSLAEPRGFIGNGRSANSAFVIRNSVFDNIAYTTTSNAEVAMIEPFNGTFLFENNIVRNITLESPIVNPNRISAPIVRNCLFYNITNGTWGPATSYGDVLSVYNCTFDGCSAVTNTTGSSCVFYNSSISNCGTTNGGTTNGGAPNTMTLLNVNLFNNTAIGPYNVGASSITEVDPLYEDPENFDFHLQRTSPLVDAGNNAYVTWTYPNPEDPENPLPPVDLDGLPRILDGDDGDEIETVDIGCYELQPPAGAVITAFVITDATSGSTLLTNGAIVDVAITLNVPAGIEVVGWLVTETDTQPTGGWLPAAPPTATIAAVPETDVILYAWIIDAEDNVSGKSAAIRYSIAVPVVTNASIVAGFDPGTAVVTWNTNILAQGSVQYRAQGTDVWATIPGTVLTTAHSILLTGIADATVYQVVIINNEIAQPAILYPEGTTIPGDANGDCRVNILDLIFIRNRLNQDVATGENWKADVNGDGRINILDLIFVRNRLNTACP
ncbi:MAG TPA: DUF1565 domain-containing protein, partial [Planctomycetota bacterium]|nr:DUF1565 domain-containing protein [Planctomycetota bacterium]